LQIFFWLVFGGAEARLLGGLRFQQVFLCGVLLVVAWCFVVTTWCFAPRFLASKFFLFFEIYFLLPVDTFPRVTNPQSDSLCPHAF